MTHKEINELEDINLKKIMKLIKKLDAGQKKLQKIINKNRDENNN
jgi:hypothetical protein